MKTAFQNKHKSIILWIDFVACISQTVDFEEYFHTYIDSAGGHLLYLAFNTFAIRIGLLRLRKIMSSTVAVDIVINNFFRHIFLMSTSSSRFISFICSCVLSLL